jgi:hypothetical protein
MKPFGGDALWGRATVVEDRWERRDDEAESPWLDWRTPARVLVSRARVIG